MKATTGISALVLFALVVAAPTARAQSSQVSGVVTSEATDEMIPGVNVAVKGTTLGTSTDAEGAYDLAVPSLQDTLVFSFVGFAKQEVPIDGRAAIDVALQRSVVQTEELVVIGYGTTTKEDLTGAVSSLDPAELERGPVATVEELLQSKVPGLSAVASGGQPGTAPSVVIRGVSSITGGTDPLRVVDGFPSNTPVDPEDVQSVEVLKGPSATAIYGARGANGVIIITTKEGSEGDLRINFRSEAGLQSPSNRLDLLSASEYQRVMNDLIDSGAESEELRVGEVANSGAGTDWQDEVLRSAPIQNYNLSFSGGTDETRYYSSLGSFLQQGIVESSSYSRYTARMNLSHEATDELNLGVKLNGQYREDDYVPNELGAINENAGALYAAYNFDPTISIRDANGDYLRSPFISVNNPLALVEGEDRNANVYRLYGTAFGEYFFLPSLSAEVRVGADLFSRRQKTYESRLTLNGRASGGIAEVEETRSRDFLFEGTVNYDDDFGMHGVNGVAGITAQTFNSQYVYNEAQNFPSDVTGADNLALADPGLNSNVSNNVSNQLLSFISRINYSLLDRYRLTATMRVDGSSRFGENNRLGYFPSVALAWNASREGFLEDIGFISQLKPRLSWGLTGNQSIGNYAALTTFSSGATAVFNNERVTTVAPSQLGNPDLKWESTEQVNAGLDFGLLDGRFTGSLDYFRKNTSDMLLALPVPSSTGFSSQITNIGGMRNSGFEFALSSNNVTGDDFSWSTELNFATLRNEVTSLGPIDRIITGSAGFTDQIAIIEPGLPLYTFYGQEVVGVWQEGEDYERYGVQPGALKYRDVNDDGAINSADRVPLGDSHPDFSWGFGNTFSYKDLSLYVFVQGAQGVSKLNNQLVLTYFPTSFRRNRIAEPLLNRWTPESPSNEYPSFVDPYAQGSHFVNSRTVQDASYARLQTVRLSYELPFENTFYRSLRVYAVGSNLYTLTGYDGVDPSVNANNSASFGVNSNVYPTARTYTLGMRIGL